MADFLSTAWFDELNASLARASAPPVGDGADTFRVVLELKDGPSTLPHALTFALSGEGARVEAGDHLAASCVIRLAFADARALTSGTLESGGALREGRLKVRGDVHALVPLSAWLIAAHAVSGTIVEADGGATTDP